MSQFKIIQKRFFAIALLVVLGACTSFTVITEEKFGKQTANIGPNLYLTTFSYENSDYPPILIVDPVLVNKKALYLGEYSGLIGVLNGNGFSVWFLHFENYQNLDLKEIGDKVLPQAISQVQKIAKRKDIILGGVSVGGQAVLHYLSQKKDPSVAKTFFLGTGMDYQYNDSFIEEMTKEKRFGSDLSLKCKQKDSFCSRYISFDEDDPKTIFLYRNLWNYLPSLDSKLWADFEAMEVPTLFVTGKLDNVSPSESVHPVYRRKKGEKYFWEVGRDNRASIDYDHMSLFSYEEAGPEIYEVIADWLKKKKGE
ncbi:alpha/beta hydrolase [Leptospira perolatii]|nr:alpha/beta hydrolase [Leptospira perolatii]